MIEIEKIISVAEAEIGYLEKRSNSSLYDKTANAGSGNYTKYWADIKPSYQGQPWCAAFVTWCLEKALGKERTTQLLKHYPFVYCPTLASLNKLYSNPKKGDIVLFYRNGTFAHTGLVVSVNGDHFVTIEGNTSGGNTIIPNGGGVYRKSYYNSNLPGTKFVRPQYITESEELTMTQYDELKATIASKDEIINKMGQEIAELQAAVSGGMIYNYVDENMPEWARESVQWCIDNGIVEGTGNGLNLDDTKLWLCVVIHRTSKMIGKFINVKV